MANFSTIAAQATIAKTLSEVARIFRYALSAVTIQSLSLTDEQVASLFQRPFPNLEDLNIVKSPSCVNFTDGAVLASITSSPKLRRFALRTRLGFLRKSPEKSITDAFVQALQDHCLRLTYVKLEGLSLLTEKGFARLGQIPSLSEICLSDVPQLSDTAIEAICNGLCKLSRFSVLRVPALTDRALLAIMTGRATMASLNALSISGSNHITDDGVCSVLHNCKRLKCIHITHCIGATDILARFAQKYPDCKLNLHLLNLDSEPGASLYDLKLHCVADIEFVTNLNISTRRYPGFGLQVLPVSGSKYFWWKLDSDSKKLSAEFLSECLSLEELSLGRSDVVDLRMANAIVTSVGSRLVKLCIGKASDVCLKVLARGCTKLKKFEISAFPDPQTRQDLESVTKARILPRAPWTTFFPPLPPLSCLLPSSSSVPLPPLFGSCPSRFSFSSLPLPPLFGSLP